MKKLILCLLLNSSLCVAQNFNSTNNPPRPPTGSDEQSPYVVDFFAEERAEQKAAEARYAELLNRAQEGDADAQYELGSMSYSKGNSQRDDLEAAKWFRLAAEQGHKEAQFTLGLMYSTNINIARDYAETLKWYRLAAEQGYDRAQYNLGIMYYNGAGVRQDYATAIEFFRLAAEQGFPDASYNLGIMYYNGTGVQLNSKTAKEFFGQACDDGSQKGCDFYRKLNEEGI